MSLDYFSKNGEILPIQDAVIPLNNIAYQYGFGVYENIKVRNDVMYFTDQHIDRLFTSAKAIGLQHSFSQDEIKNQLNALKNKLQIESYNFKILLLGGKEPLLFIIPLAPKFTDRKLYSEGAKTITVSYEREFPNAKTLNMLPSYLAYTKAREQNCYDALLLDAKNNIVEGTRTNFFVVKDQTIITPPKEKILEGVTKITVLHTAQTNGFTIEEKDIPYDKINDYDGAFLTATSAKIVPIAQIDDFRFPQIPEKLKELMRLYDGFLDASKGIFES